MVCLFRQRPFIILPIPQLFSCDSSSTQRTMIVLYDLSYSFRQESQAMRTCRIFFLILCSIPLAATIYAEQNCTSASIPASTPDSQFIDNNDGTVTDSKTGLMWKKCLEGASGDTCEKGSVGDFTWQAALQQTGTVNSGGGFAGYTDWRLPNIRELLSIVEEQCYDPSINLNRFPNTPVSYVWSSSPDINNAGRTWLVFFKYGNSAPVDRYNAFTVRLVRGGQ
ncbi:MAG: DUF1566 domain-containing protein [Candidatus Electrothrix sp. ATG1]|nr:DUF1566 domain-containing protein [Candidatus Electrothrix sp. ATG1]